MGRPRSFDTDTVLVACRETFWRQGYDATTILDLTAATGLRTQSLYTAFGTKRDLFLRALESYCTAQIAGLEVSVARARSPWSAVRKIATYQDAGRLPLPEYGCLLARSMVERGRQDAQVRALGEATYAATMRTLLECVERAHRAGEIAPTVSAEELARNAFTISQGIATLRATLDDDGAYASARRSAVLMLDGLACPRG